MSHLALASPSRWIAVRCLIAASVAVSSATWIGCGGNGSRSKADPQLRAAMKVLGLEYGSFLVDSNGATPVDESALRQYLELRAANLRDYGVKSPDDLLRTGRDGQPLQVIYGTKAPVSERPDYVWVAHEQTAVDGTRLACDSRGGVYELTDEDFSRQFSR